MKIQNIKYLFFTVLVLTTQIVSTFASGSGTLGVDKIHDDLYGGNGILIDTVSGGVRYILSFLILLSVLYGIYGGYLILTAASDEEKVKKGRTIIIQMLIGIIIIYLAGPLVNFLLGPEGILRNRL